MAKFAPVAPIQVLEQMYNQDPLLFGEYHLLLAHHTVDEARRFSELFRRIAQDDIIQPTIIMDNSVVELGGFVSLELMVHAFNIINDAAPHLDVVPVLPDVMGKGHETRKAVGDAYHAWDEAIPNAPFMAVCQGDNWNDYIESLVSFADLQLFPRIKYLGIPRYLARPEILGTRVDATRAAFARRAPGQKIHLLGFCDNVNDDLLSAGIDSGLGIDSAVPLRFAGQWSPVLDAGPRPEDWFETAVFDQQMEDNLFEARNMFKTLPVTA